VLGPQLHPGALSANLLHMAHGIDQGGTAAAVKPREGLVCVFARDHAPALGLNGGSTVSQLVGNRPAAVVGALGRIENAGDQMAVRHSEPSLAPRKRRWEVGGLRSRSI
jgi:hypothetical protein